MRIAIDTGGQDSDDYLRSCARIRRISVSSLLRRLMHHIADDQMVASILDDEDSFTRRKSEHHYRGPAAPW